jgi:hypothetical protein
MHSLSLLTLILTLIALTQACHHPSHPVACSLSLKRAKITANSTHVIIQGTTTQSTRCKSKRDDEAALGSVIHVFTKETVHIKDGQGHGHTGNDCQINVPYTLPTLEKAETTKVILPLEKDVKIHCERRRFKGQQQKPHTSSSSAKKSTPTTTTKEKPTATPSKEKPTTTTKHHSKPTTTKKKDPKPTHGSDDWEYDDGQVTFFTPNQGACGEWNDDNDFIAALVSPPSKQELLTHPFSLQGGDLYGDMDEESKLCGKKILIQGPKGNEITVTVRDACPPCDADHIDLSPA